MNNLDKRYEVARIAMSAVQVRIDDAAIKRRRALAAFDDASENHARLQAEFEAISREVDTCLDLLAAVRS